MSPDEYTPTTDKVREDYVFDCHDRWDLEREHAFDRWLAEIRAAARDADPIPGAESAAKSAVTIAENEMVRQDRGRWLEAHDAATRAERVAPDDAVVEVMDYVASKAIGDLAAELVRTRAERDEARATIRA